MRKFISVIILVLMISALFSCCGTKTDPGELTETIVDREESTNAEVTNEVVTSEDITAETSESIEETLTAIERDTSVYYYKSGETEYAENILNAALYYEGKEVVTLIRIGSISEDKTYVTSDEVYNSIDAPMCITLSTGTTAKVGDVIRVKGTVKEEKLIKATILETNGNASKEYAAHLNAQKNIELANATKLTWDNKDTISNDEIIKYKATIVITDTNKCHATLDGHTISYVLTDENTKLIKGNTYTVYGSAIIDEGNTDNAEDIGNIFFFITDIE